MAGEVLAAAAVHPGPAPLPASGATMSGPYLHEAPMFAETIAPDVELRQLCADDALALFDLTDRNRAHLQHWLPTVAAERKTLADTEQFIAGLRNAPDGSRFVCGIWVAGGLAGVVSLFEPADEYEYAQLGYWLGVGYEGRGLATIACQALIIHAFECFDLSKVEIRCGKDNIRSKAVAERLGFRAEDILFGGLELDDRVEDLMVYGLLAEDWRRRPLRVRPRGRRKGART
ncbi:MAG: GNAT family N-acetyltransferase [Cyanobacteria bacterium REEB65]|nr:GNAT family N-acetyltransferase [Cyanobacteria bacterium REEB65]